MTLKYQSTTLEAARMLCRRLSLWMQPAFFLQIEVNTIEGTAFRPVLVITSEFSCWLVRVPFATHINDKILLQGESPVSPYYCVALWYPFSVFAYGGRWCFSCGIESRGEYSWVNHLDKILVSENYYSGTTSASGCIGPSVTLFARFRSADKPGSWGRFHYYQLGGGYRVYRHQRPRLHYVSPLQLCGSRSLL